MQRLFILSVLVAATTSALADERAIDLQVDPVPFFLDGYAVEAGGSLGGHRAFATVVAYDAAGFLREDERF